MLLRVATLTIVLILPATVVPQPISGDACAVERFREMGGAWIGSKQSVSHLEYIAREGRTKIFRPRKRGKLFAGVPVAYRHYGFVDGVLTFVRIRTQSFEYSGPAVKGYKTAPEHLKVVAHLNRVNGGCPRQAMTRELHAELSGTCEAHFDVRHCNAPILWADRPIRITSVFALEKDGPTPNGPHLGFTAIEYAENGTTSDPGELAP